MTGTNLYHALGLHMHQPPGNLRLLIDSDAWTAEEIIRCYQRPARYALLHRDLARLHVGFSGILLEQLLDADIVDRYRHILDIPALLAAYREAENVELIGMGYYHPLFPLIPEADWQEQLTRGREIVEETFGRAPRGFWPPEMAFSMAMVPHLVRAGYEYVVVDGVHVRPADGLSDIYRPYLACYEGACITIVPRDRVISNAQESGLDPDWFSREASARTQASPRPAEPRLVTTWSDGESGGWFRQTHEESGFFGHFFSPCLERVRDGRFPLVPVGLSEYLEKHPPTTRCQVQTGAWNVGATSGFDFQQWDASDRQKAAGQAIHDLSSRYWALRRMEKQLGSKGRQAMRRARELILEAETSCFLFWGDAWIPRLHERTARAGSALRQAEQQLGVPPFAAGEFCAGD